MLIGVINLGHYKWLEEGSEEFILKLGRLLDVNKLRPYIMRMKKLKNQKQ